MIQSVVPKGRKNYGLDRSWAYRLDPPTRRETLSGLEPPIVTAERLRPGPSAVGGARLRHGEAGRSRLGAM